MARTRFFLLLILFLLCGIGSAAAAGGKEAAYPKGGKWDLRKEQHAHFPLPLPAYTDPEHAASERRMMGLVAAMAMMTTTKRGSV